MKGRILLGIMLTLLLIGMHALAFNISKAESSEPPATPWGDWKHYHNYAEIVDTLLYLNTTYPDIVDVFRIGESWQGRTIYCVRLTSESQTQPKPKVLFVGYHHSEEPISAELPLYFVVQAAIDYGTPDPVTRMIDLCEIYVVVALNPDGFHLFEMNDFQHKNARPTDEDEDGLLDEDPPEDEDGNGFIEYLVNMTTRMRIRWEGVDNDSDEEFGEDWVGGVNLNQNYGFAWNAPPSPLSGSTDPRSPYYKGPAPFSEPETQALRDLALQHDFKYAISFHSGAEIIFYPWGYTREPPPDAEIFIEIGKDLSTIIGYPYGQISTSMHTTVSGIFDDWMYGNRSVIAFTCEIFSGPSNEIFSESGPTPDTMWWGGSRYAYNPRPYQIENVILRWLPVFTYVTDRAILTISQFNTSLTIDVPSTPQGIPFSSECTIEATLKDENDNPLQNFDIDFYVCGTDCMDWIGTAKTDSNGVASLTYTFSRAGTYNITAMFSGTTSYVKSSSENVDIIIIDYTPYLVGGGLIAVAIIGVVGYIVFRRRKKAITMPKTAKEA